MVKRVTGVMFVVLLFAPAVAAQRQPEQSYRAYLPMIATPSTYTIITIA